ncbi:hypothetical protein BLA29_007011, partial [Euroglyphus maynei]
MTNLNSADNTKSKSSSLLLFYNNDEDDDKIRNHSFANNDDHLYSNTDKLIDFDMNDNHHHHQSSTYNQQQDDQILKINYENNYIEPESPDHFGDPYDSDNFLNECNRELQIQTATEERKNEYVRYENYTIFIGTWNVNGQIMTKPEIMQTHFLACDTVAPDFYAIGFQELDLSKEAFLFNDNKKEDYWLQICEQSLHPDRKYFLLKKIRLI